MPTNPWVALDTTGSRSPAGELRRLWDAYLGDGRIGQVRGPIAESWGRSQAAGVDPSESRAPTLLADRHDVRERWEAHPLEAAAPLIRRWLKPFAADSEHLIVVSDAEGLILWLDGNAKLRSKAADSVNFVEGALWSEAGAGTNAIGTALAADHPVQVHAAEHFSETVHAWTCSAAPVRDPEDGHLLGVIDLTGLMSDVNRDSPAVALAAARAVEADLHVRMQERDAQLRVRYLERMSSSRGRLALVSRSGRVIADHPDGLLGAERIEVPPGGGAFMLPDGGRGIAEPLDREDGYLVHPLGETSRVASRLERLERTSGTPAENRVAEKRDDLTGWHRAQLELSRLAEEQAALRRVATLVAGQASADEIFVTVAEEVAELLGADRGTVCRYEPSGVMSVVALWMGDDRTLPAGTRVALDGDSVAVQVQQSGRPSRIDSYENLSGPVIDVARSLGREPGSTVGAPILVEGRVWGAILATTTTTEPFPDETEARLMGFAELVATAISNAVAREELDASRARIVASADEIRRRVARDLHDGAQQRLVHSVVVLKLALRAMRGGEGQAESLVGEALEQAEQAIVEVRELAHGMHPRVLSMDGLVPSLRALCGRSAIPVKLELSAPGRFPKRVEVAAYYVISELLTNAAKHARASVVNVAVGQVSGALQLSVRDDGVGGADQSRGSGLIGVRDRVEAIGGRIAVESPVGAGTTVRVSLPLG